MSSKNRAGVLYGTPEYRSVNREQVLRVGAYHTAVSEEMMLIIAHFFWIRYLKWKLPFILLSRIIAKNLTCSVLGMTCCPIISEWLVSWFVLFECEDHSFGFGRGKVQASVAKEDCNIIQSSLHFGEHFQGIAICNKDDYITCVLKKFSFFHNTFLDSASLKDN